MSPSRFAPFSNLGRTAFFTLPVDLLFVAAVLVAPFVPFLSVVVIAGLVLAVLTIMQLDQRVLGRRADLPWLWFVWAVLLPVSCHMSVSRGSWQGDRKPAALLRYRVGVTLLALLLGLTAASQQLDRYVQSAGLEQLDQRADTYLTSSLEKASATLLVARTINGVLSLAKSIEVQVFVGITPGALLDPVDDLIERFSLVMLASTASISVQLILMKIGSVVGLGVLLPAGLLLLLLGIWAPSGSMLRRLVRLGGKLMLLAAVVRVAVPVVALSGAAISDHFLADTYAEAAAGIEEVQRLLTKESSDLTGAASTATPGAPAGAAKPGIWEQLKKLPDATGAALSRLDLQRRLATMQTHLLNAGEHVMRLIAVFLFEALFLPLLVGWLLLKLVGGLLGESRNRPAPVTQDAV